MATQNNKRYSKAMPFLFFWLGTITIILAALIAVLINQVVVFSPKRITSFDMQKVVKAFSAQLAKSDLSKAQKQALSLRFVHALTQVSNQYARDNNALVLTSAAVIAGGKDITHTLSLNIKKELHQSKAN